MGAPELKPEKLPEERRTNKTGRSFEAWARSLEAAGLTFDSTTRRWNLLPESRIANKAIRVEQLALIYRRSKIISEQIAYKLDLHRWGKMAQNAAKETFGPRTRTELHNNFTEGRPDGVWLVLEFTRPNSRETSMGYTNLFDLYKFHTGFLALKIAPSIVPAGFKLRITKTAGLGYLPTGAWDNMHRFIRRSLGLPGVARTAPEIQTDSLKNCTELTVAITELIGMKEADIDAKIQKALEESAKAQTNTLTNMTPSLDQAGNLVWTAERSGKNENNSPRESRHPTSEDPAPSRSRHPDSSQIDPELNPDLEGVTLDAISKMIRKLNLIWPAFESSTIAASILSEILGDSWASQPPEKTGATDPFKMAKTAWERAGGMRANRLRILRKIAVAARSHGNETDEKMALREIIQLEKRRENLASAMVRMAQLCPETSGDNSNEFNVEKLLLNAASLESDDEQVNFACFNEMVASGFSSAAINLGKQLLHDSKRLHSPGARAELAIIMAQLSASELKDDAGAIAYLNEARKSDPSSTKAIAEIAAIATRTGNKELETASKFDLAEIFFTNGPKASQPQHEFESTAAENNLMALMSALDRVTDPVSAAINSGENLLDTTRTITLLTRPFEDHRTLPENRTLWLSVLDKLANRSDFPILRPFVVRAFLRLCCSDDDRRESAHDQDTIARLTYRLVNPGDLIEGKEILAAAARSIVNRDHTNRNQVIPSSEAFVDILEKITLIPDNTEWMTENAKALFSLLELTVKVPIITKALNFKDIGNTDWLRKVVDQTITNHPMRTDPSNKTTENSNLNQIARLSFSAVDAAFVHDDSTRAKEVIFLAISQFEDLIHVFIDAFETESAAERRIFLLQALAGATIHALDDGLAAPNLNSRIRSMTLTFRPEYRSSQKETDDPVGKILFDSICMDGQSMPLDEIEIDFLLHRRVLNNSPELLQCLLHQASVHDSPPRASELFKVCLDHAILELNDEALASKIIGAWLTRLKPHQNTPVIIREQNWNTQNTLDSLAAELILLLGEFDQKFADGIREQLGSAGFINPSDPVPAIAGACRGGKFEIARNLFRRAIAAASGSEGDLAMRLYHALDQMDVKAGLKKPDKSTIIGLLLDWYGDPYISDTIPIELALLASEQLIDRNRARSIVEKAQAKLDLDSPEDQRLWIPHYMLLAETGSKEEVDRQLDKILPGIRANPGLLANYPFTVESLEAERGFAPVASQISITEPVQPDLTLEILDATVPSSPGEAPVEAPAITAELPEAAAQTITFMIPDLALPQILLENQTPVPLDPAVASEPVDEPGFAVTMATDAPPYPDLAIEMEKEEEKGEETETKTEIKTETKTKTGPQEVALVEEMEVPPPAPIVLASVPEGNDWRSAVRNRKLTHKSTAEILASEMPNKIEKHVALQAVAVMRGESHILERWDWRVWRKPHEYGYSRQGKNRFPSGLSPRIMKTPSFRLLLRAAPILALCFPERFTMKGLAKSLKLSVRQIEAKRQRLNWTTGIAGHAGFGFHSKLFSERGLCLFALQGLGPEIFYDAGSSSIYIDDSFFARKPPTHLYHRIMFLLYSIRTQFYPLLNLNPETQILTELNKLKAVMDRGPLAVLAAQAKITDSRMAKLMKPQDFEEFKQLFSRAGEFTGDDIKDSSKSMQQYVWRLLLADSLDLTGIIEAMLDVDLLLPGSVKPGEILLMSSQVDPLINFALALKLDENPTTT